MNVYLPGESVILEQMSQVSERPWGLLVHLLPWLTTQLGGSVLMGPCINPKASLRLSHADAHDVLLSRSAGL